MSEEALNWGEVLGHPTERHRPLHPHSGTGATPEEISYTMYLNIGKRVFLERIGTELRKRYPKIRRIKVRSYGDDYSNLGFRLMIPRLWWMNLTCIGDHDDDLCFHTNSEVIKQIIKELAPEFEKEVLSIETKKSTLDPHKVYIKSNDCWILSKSECIEKYLKRKSPKEQ